MSQLSQHARDRETDPGLVYNQYLAESLARAKACGGGISPDDNRQLAILATDVADAYDKLAAEDAAKRGMYATAAAKARDAHLVAAGRPKLAVA
ncbi:MAG TPA: hypothetical protein VGL02_26615 [Streptomyces sp.]